MRTGLREENIPQQHGREPYCARGSWPYWTFQPMLVPISQMGTVQRPSHSPSTEKGLTVPLPLMNDIVPFRPAILVAFDDPDASQAIAEDLVMS